MPAYTDPLEIYRGEKKTWQFTVTAASAAGSPQNISSASIKFAARNAIPASNISSDTDAVFARSTESGCGISITDASAGKFTLTIIKANTSALAVAGGGNDYFYGLELQLSGDTEPSVIAQGQLRVLPDIVRGL